MKFRIWGKIFNEIVIVRIWKKKEKKKVSFSWNGGGEWDSVVNIVR